MGFNSDTGSSSREESRMFKDINLGKYGRLKSSIEEPPESELKPLPEYLQYEFLAEGSKLLVIIPSDLTARKNGRLLIVLKNHKKAIASKF